MLQFTADMLVDMAALREFNKNAWLLLTEFGVTRPPLEVELYPTPETWQKGEQRARLREGPSPEEIAEAFRVTGVSERDVSREAGCSRSFVHYVKTGQRVPEGMIRQNILNSIHRVYDRREARRGCLVG